MTQGAEEPVVESPAEAPPAPVESPAEAPSEPAAEPTPEEAAAKAEADRRQARIDAATKAERDAATKRRERREASRAAEERRLAQVERERLAADRARWEQEQREAAEAVRKGGLSALKARTGLDYKDLTKEWVDASTPEAKQRAEVEARLAEQQRQIQELTAREQRRAAEQAFTQLEGALERHADEFPYAYEMPNALFRAAVPVIAKQLVDQGRQPTQRNVLKLLDEHAKSDHDERESRRSALQKRTKSQPSNGTAQSTSPTASRAVRTLTSQDSATKSSSPGPKSEAEKDEEILATVREMLKGT